MSLTDSELNHLLNFIGYGNLNADVWWLGMEEGTGQDDNLDENLRARLAFDQVEDLRDACVRNGVTKFHEGKRISQATWWVMCEVMLGLSGQPIDRESKRAYQAERLGRCGDETLLLELMPLPKPNIASWGYEQLIPQFESRDDYYAQILPERISLIQNLIATHQPKLVVAYGKGFWHYYKSLFSHVEFSTPELAEKFQVGCGLTSVILSPHPTSWDINGQIGTLTDLAKKITR